jgi:hypothetical protein
MCRDNCAWRLHSVRVGGKARKNLPKQEGFIADANSPRSLGPGFPLRPVAAMLIVPYQFAWLSLRRHGDAIKRKQNESAFDTGNSAGKRWKLIAIIKRIDAGNAVRL